MSAQFILRVWRTMKKLRVQPRNLRIILILFFFLCTLCVIKLKTRDHTLRDKIILKSEELERKDWNDFKLLVNEAMRVGPGEKGLPVVFTDPKEDAKGKAMIKEEGFNVLISDMVSPDRSLPEVRLDT
jgi:predicted Holliday junction resolvase-like endonuclease